MVWRGGGAGQCLLGLSLPSSVHLWDSAGRWAPNETDVLETGVPGEIFRALVVLLGAEMAAGWKKLLAMNRETQA